MEDLKSLIDTISRNKVKKIEIVGRPSGKASLLDKLYLGISYVKFASVEEAAKTLFENETNRKEYYNRLKRQLKDRLLNTLFFIDINKPAYSDLQRAYYTCYKDSTAVKILLSKNNRLSAISLAQKTLRAAKKFEFTDIIISLSKELRMHYGIIIGDKSKFKHYNKEVKFYTEVYLSELQAEEYYAEVIINFVNSSAYQKDVISLADKVSQELSKKAQKFNSYWLNYLTFLILVLRYEIANDYENVLEICKKALAYFESKKHLASNRTLFNFQFKSIGGHIKLKQFQEGQDKIDNCLSLLEAGSGNWFLTLHYQMLQYYHSKNFGAAFSTYQSTIAHPNFKKIFKNISEHWHIHEAFIHYFSLTQKLDKQDLAQSQMKRFRMARFLNEVPIQSKDKRGNNITIIILQILFLLQQKKYGAIIDKMESLQTYTHRYLRQDDTFRSNCFIKMLLCLPASSFHKKAVLRKADKYWKKLQSIPIEKANQSAEMEIVPYEMLWEFVLEGLDEKWH